MHFLKTFQALTLSILAICAVGSVDAAPTIMPTSVRDITNDAFSPTSSITILGSSTVVVGNALNLFGATIGGIPGDPDDALFNDAPIGTTYFVNWKTSAPILLSSYRVTLSDDAPTNNRAIMQLRLFSSTDATFSHLTLLSSAVILSPYSVVYGGSVIAVTDQFTPVTAQFFRLEFVNASVSGPRIIEVDGFPMIGVADAFGGLDMALAQREILLHVDRLATRDVNGRLFRLRAGADESAELPVPHFESDGKEVLTRDHSGKVVLLPRDTQEPDYSEVFRRFIFFADGDFGRADQDDIASHNGFKGDTYAGTLGFEYRATRELRLGVGGTYVENNTTLNSDLGRVDISGFGISGYASWVHRCFYVDALYSFGVYDDEIRRETVSDGTVTADPQSTNHVVALTTGYNFHCGHWITGPIAALEYTAGDLEGYSEKGSSSFGVRVGEQDYDSLISKLGWQSSYRITTAFGAVTPQIHASWDRENLNDSKLVNAQLLSGAFNVSANTNAPGDDYLALGGGVLIDIGERCSIVADAEDYLARDNRNDFFASARVAVKF